MSPFCTIPEHLPVGTSNVLGLGKAYITTVLSGYPLGGPPEGYPGIALNTTPKLTSFGPPKGGPECHPDVQHQGAHHDANMHL